MVQDRKSRPSTLALGLWFVLGVGGFAGAVIMDEVNTLWILRLPVLAVGALGLIRFGQLLSKGP